MRKKGFKFELILGVIVIVIVPLAVVGYFSSRKATEVIRQNSQLQSVRTATALAKSVSLVLAEQTWIVRGFAENFRNFGGMDIRFYGGPDIDDLTARRLKGKINNTVEQLGINYESIYLGDRNGKLFAGALGDGDTPFFGLDISQLPAFQAVKETGEPTKSSILSWRGFFF